MIDKTTLENFIEESILVHIDSADRENVAQKVRVIATNYMEPWDTEAITLLSYAAKAGQFNKYFDRLVNLHRDNNLCFVDPEHRSDLAMPAVKRINDLFRNACKELGVSLPTEY
tara:strand:+ start:3834 stop:4175 length:342 start_codon:yes stop_codon:yes gene_type:complete